MTKDYHYAAPEPRRPRPDTILARALAQLEASGEALTCTEVARRLKIGVANASVALGRLQLMHAAKREGARPYRWRATYALPAPDRR